MGLALLFARLLLAIVFLVAGLAKLADLAGSRQAMRDFGVPVQFATPFGTLLPLAELAVAVAFILTVSAWRAAIGALVLLLLFVTGISYNLARGRTPDCHCFGQLHSAPIGWPTLVRNLLLTAIAGFILGFGRINAGPNALDWLAVLTLAQRIELLVGVILVALLALEGWVLWQTLRQQGRILLRIEALEALLSANGSPDTGGLPIGSVAPGFALPDLHGNTITLDSLRSSSKPLILIFSDPECASCAALLPQVSRWQRDYAGKLMIALISRGTPEANRAKTAKQAITPVLLQQDHEIAEAYNVLGAPSAILIRPDGTIGSPMAQGADPIGGLVTGAISVPTLKYLPMAAPTRRNGHAVAAASGQSTQLKRGDPAPAFTLPDLSGRPVHLADFRGSNTLLLFWNPDCGYCQRMLEDLKAWEAQAPNGAPKLLIVSRDTVEANQAMGLRSPTVLEQDFAIASMFGATGTPMAVLVDAEGKIASEVAAGAQAVLALARGGQSQVPAM